MDNIGSNNFSLNNSNTDKSIKLEIQIIEIMMNELRENLKTPFKKRKEKIFTFYEKLLVLKFNRRNKVKELLNFKEMRFRL